MIKGTPGVIHKARALSATGANHAATVQHNAAQDILDRMREEARRTPAWEGLEDGITMRYQDGAYVFGFDPEHPGAQRATELEFGTETVRPSSVFRKVLHGARSDIEWKYRDDLQGWAR
jgi:hypothetical protein